MFQNEIEKLKQFYAETKTSFESKEK